MAKELGEFLGWAIVVFYGLTVLNFVLKAINKKYSKEIGKNAKFKKIYSYIMRFIVKNHKLFGLLTIVFILAHFLIQFNAFGLNIKGAIAAILMVLQIFLGIYGAYIKKKRNSLWFYIHRTIAVLLLFTILLHIVIK